MGYDLMKEECEILIWTSEGAGYDQVGREVEFDGKKGVVISGTFLTITVIWEKKSWLRKLIYTVKKGLYRYF